MLLNLYHFIHPFISQIFIRHVMGVLQVVFSGSIWSPRYLLGINTCEKKGTEAELGQEKSNCKVELTRSQLIERGALTSDCPLELSQISFRTLSSNTTLPFLLSYWMQSSGKGMISGEAIIYLQLRPTLMELTAGG